MENQVIPEDLPVLPSEPPREALITTAVKFLQNPKVADSSLENKKKFLTGKGLTPEEIEIAVTRSGGSIVQVTNPGTIVKTVPLQPVSAWSRLKDYSLIAVVLGSVVYGCYYVFKTFIQPLFVKHAKQQDERLDSLEASVKDVSVGISRDMQEIQTTLAEIQQHLEENSTKLNYLSSDGKSTGRINSTSTENAVADLKSEISSIKGLLLSRRQFPATPNTPPVIPSWQQLKPQDESEEKQPEMNGHTSGSDETTVENGITDTPKKLTNGLDKTETTELNEQDSVQVEID